MHANDADNLGGLGSTSYQKRVSGTCANRTSASAVGSDGSLSCTSPVLPINLDTANATLKPMEFGDWLVTVTCHESGSTYVNFFNQAGHDSTLNWLYGDGTSVSASGVALNSGDSHQYGFSFAGKRIEGQFILADGNEEATVNLHAFDYGNGNSCEARGTVEYAHN